MVESFKNKKFRSSIVSLFDNTLKLTWLAIVIILTNFAIITKKIQELNLNFNVNVLIILVLCAFIIVIFFYNLFLWHISRYQITSTSVIIYKNIFIDDKKQILISSLANINVSRNLFEKIFKLYRITGYTFRKNKIFADFNIVMCEKVFKEVICQGDNKENIDININNKLVYKFNFSDILKHSILSIPVSSMVLIINFILFLFNLVNNGSFIKEVLYNSLGFIITIFGFVFPILYNIIKNVIKYYGFRISKIENYIEIKFGIFTTNAYIIPINKIKGVIIDVSFLSKIFGCYKVNIINAGIGDIKSKLDMIIPICSKKKCISIINEVLPEFNNSNISHKNQPIESFIVLFSKVLIVMIIIVIPVVYININIAMIISFSLFVIIILIYFIKRVKISNDNICIINGIFIKRMKILKYNDIETIQIKEGIISRKFGLCKMYITIMADLKNVRSFTGYLNIEDMYKVAGNFYHNSH